MTADATGPSFIVVSDVVVSPEGSEALEAAFRARLGEVEQVAGFQRLEVWRDARVAGSYQMVSWWDDEQSWRAYMTSPAHDRSHARIPRDPVAPRGRGVRRMELVCR